jgi:hypothetical protein
MSFPTLAELYEEVDREFFEANPGAPARLDPNDSSQSSLVEDWNKRFDDKVNRWTDAVFKANYPFKATPLDPSDEAYVKVWLEMRDRIREEGPAVFHAAPAPGTRLLSVRQIEWAGYALTFDGPVELDAVSQTLWPNGAPSGPELTAAGPSEYHLKGVTWEALEAMPHEIASMISEAGVLTAE